MNSWFSHQVIYKRFNILCDQTLHDHEHETLMDNFSSIAEVNGTEACEAKLFTANSQVRRTCFHVV